MFDAIRDWLFDVTLLETTLRLYVAAAIGQTAFVVLWASLPWWKTRVGRAMMVKSASLMIVLDFGVINYYWGPFHAWVGVALFALVVVGIYSQFFTFLYEDIQARRRRRERRVS